MYSATWQGLLSADVKMCLAARITWWTTPGLLREVCTASNKRARPCRSWRRDSRCWYTTFNGWKLSSYCSTTMQWNLSNADTLGTKIIVLISEVSLFQGENNMFYVKLWLSRVSWLTKVSLFQRCPLREVLLYVKPLLVATILYPLPVGPMGWGETTGVSVNGVYLMIAQSYHFGFTTCCLFPPLSSLQTQWGGSGKH